MPIKKCFHGSSWEGKSGVGGTTQKNVYAGDYFPTATNYSSYSFMCTRLNLIHVWNSKNLNGCVNEKLNKPDNIN